MPYSLLTRLVGRQRIELKGANAGGDGGAALSMRTLFKFVGYWNPSLKLDHRGRGEFEFTLPDNLTGWRVFVLAATPTDRMGLGEAGFVVNLATEIRPVMPNQVSEEDRFLAGFSVMNRTDTTRDIDIRLSVRGDAREAIPHEQTLRLSPYQRRTVNVPIQAARLASDRDSRQGRIVFEAMARDAMDGDALHHELPVHSRRTLQTAATYGSTIGELVTETLRFPQEIHTDVGEVVVDLSASVIGNLDGAFRYMRWYPYASWEQELSKAVMASQFRSLNAYFTSELRWPQSEEIIVSTLASAADHQAPNGGMTYYLPRDQYASPYLSAYTALAFSWLRDAGHVVPETVELRLHAYLEELLKRDLAPTFYSRGMVSSVRAVALAALARYGKVTSNDLSRYREHVERMSLFGKAHYLLAALAVDGAGETAREVRDSLMARSVRGAGKLAFNETLDDGYLRIFASSMRSNCAILTALVAGAEREADATSLEAERATALVRTITQTRGDRDHWENTQENVFCTAALGDYARRHEDVAPKLRVAVELEGEPLGGGDLESFRDAGLSLVRPITARDPGRAARLSIRRSGEGRLYYSVRMSYANAVQVSERVNSGIDIRREYSVERGGEWVLLEDPVRVRRGELVRVDIFVSLPVAGQFVVVDDAVPGGLEALNRDLANVSLTDADAGSFQAAGGSWWFRFGDWHHYGTSRWSFYHQEIRHEAVRFYSDYLPAGRYHVSYTAQAVAEGTFQRPPVRAEQMYDPDVYGLGLPGSLTVDGP